MRRPGGRRKGRTRTRPAGRYLLYRRRLNRASVLLLPLPSILSRERHPARVEKLGDERQSVSSITAALALPSLLPPLSHSSSRVPLCLHLSPPRPAPPLLPDAHVLLLNLVYFWQPPRFIATLWAQDYIYLHSHLPAPHLLSPAPLSIISFFSPSAS